ncbi:hypothetical protein [Streptomyces broussonetiae]|uniref:Uncharacterized protein n=1 Tax=Streptomyces broussonetiae TaxID=2686304 RepID=A0ABV5EC33_9ACTN
MTQDSFDRFLQALAPEDRKAVRQASPDRQARLTSAWERELAQDDELDVLDELSPPAAEAEAARRVVAAETGRAGA